MSRDRLSHPPLTLSLSKGSHTPGAEGFDKLSPNGYF
jgi:hypothetical protein